MKFLCVPCDSPMKLQAVRPPDDGSLSVVYGCPECGYEVAMLTNAYETQLVQSLGVRIGPDIRGGAASGGAAAGSGAAAPQAQGAPGASASRCPFSAMIPPVMEAPPRAPQAGDEATVRWTGAAEARLANIPDFVRPMARIGIERFARERGVVEVDEAILEAARAFFGM